MRIIGGEYRGIRINLPRNFRARPTTDMAKESLFNILNNRLNFEEIKVLDLFSGTGGISFEFASRGCTQIILVEKNPVHYKHIINTIEKLKLKDIIKPIKSDVFRYIETGKVTFDLIFADPPFNLENLETIPGKIMQSEILKQGGTLILEHSRQYNFNNHDGYYEIRKYGGVHFSFFEKR